VRFRSFWKAPIIGVELVGHWLQERALRVSRRWSRSRQDQPLQLAQPDAGLKSAKQLVRAFTLDFRLPTLLRHS
jgi:hypothetical protein